MNKFIIANSTTGEIYSVQEAAFTDNIQEGIDPSTNTYVKEVPFEADTSELLTDYYWDRDTETLVLYPTPKPSRSHYWTGSSWTKNTILFDREVRAKRQEMLSSSDWTQVPDSPLTPEQKTAWAIYRQELRDITDNLTGAENTLDDVPWPSKPTA